MVSLTPGLSTMRFRELRILCLLGRVFGNQRFLSEWLSFCGQLLMVGFLLWIISYLGVALRQIGVVCVVVMGSRWTTFFFIVMLHIPYGLLCFRLLVFIGLCQDRWQDFYFFGINGLGIILQIFGIWFQVAWCGLLSWNEICHSFEDTKKTLEELKVLCQRCLFEWFLCWGFTNCSFLFEFMFYLRFVLISLFFVVCFIRILLFIIMNNLYFYFLFSWIIFLWLPINKSWIPILWIRSPTRGPAN